MELLPSPEGWNRQSLEASGSAGTRRVAAQWPLWLQGPSLGWSRAGSGRSRFMFALCRSGTADCWEVCTHTAVPQVGSSGRNCPLYPARFTGRRVASRAEGGRTPGLLLAGLCLNVGLPSAGPWVSASSSFSLAGVSGLPLAAPPPLGLIPLAEGWLQ